MLKIDNSLLMILLGLLVISSYLNLRSLTLCILVGYLTSHFTKNMKVIVASGLLVPFLVNVRKFSEGLENKEDADDASDADESKDKDSKSDLYELSGDDVFVESKDSIKKNDVTDVYIKNDTPTCDDVLSKMTIESKDVTKLKMKTIEKDYKAIQYNADVKCHVDDKKSIVVFDEKGAEDDKTLKALIEGDSKSISTKYLIVKANEKHYVTLGSLFTQE